MNLNCIKNCREDLDEVTFILYLNYLFLMDNFGKDLVVNKDI